MNIPAILQPMLQQQGEDILRILTNIIGARDEYTQGHSHHVYVITETLAKLLPAYGLDVPRLKTAALLHDIGKILIPDHILNKDGQLSEEEWLVMRSHPAEGKKLLEGTVFDELGDWILYHHERLDCQGYYGLCAKDIPVESRLIAVADTFSALHTYRVYRPARSLDETVRVMRGAAGTQLDTGILAAFFSLDSDAMENLQCNCDICARRRAG